MSIFCINLERESKHLFCLLSRLSGLILICAICFFANPGFAGSSIQITDKTNPKIAELYQKLQEKQAEITTIESKRMDALNENLDAMRENEQRLENRMLGAATTAATGIGGMEAASAYAETRADADAMQEMRAYLATFSCEYGNGQTIEYGPDDITTSGGNDLIEYFNEYKSLAAGLKETKSALGLTPGIESEIVLNRADTGLYENAATGKTSGMYASLARGILNPTGEDAAQIAADTQKSSEKLKAGAIAAGAGVVGGIIGNAVINKDAPKESSEKINQEYDAQVSKINTEATQIESDLNTAIAENAAAVHEYNEQLAQHQQMTQAIQQSPTTCRELLAEYVARVGTMSPVENDTDMVPNTDFPDLADAQEKLKKCTNCDTKGGVFNPVTLECPCPSDKPLEQDGKCVEKPVEPEPVAVVPDIDDDETVNDETATQPEEEKSDSDDPAVCAVGLKHTAGFGIVAGETRVGDRCTSAQVLDGKVFKRNNGTCGCTAIVCETRAGRAADAVGGRCVCNVNKGYKEEKGKCVCDEEKGYKSDNGQCVNQNAGGGAGEDAGQPAAPEPQKKYKYYNCGDTRQLPTDVNNKETCKSIGDFSGQKVTPLEADGLMKEYALEKYNDTIVCDEKSHRIQSDGEKYRQCTTTTENKQWYEFKFKSLDAGNKDFFSALCSIWGLKYGKSDDNAYYACKGTVSSECEKISAAVKRTFFPGGEVIYENSKCVIKVHETAQSSRYQINSKAVTIDKLKTTNGIDPAHFYSKDLQVNASSDLYKHIQKYIFNELNLSVAPMQCFSGIVDNVLVIPMTAEEATQQQAKQNECIDAEYTAMIGARGAGTAVATCTKKYPIPEQMSDLLTCEYNGNRFDLMFKKLDVKWDKKSIGGYQGLTCLSAGGSFTGKNCTLASKAQCDAVNAEFKKHYPGAKGMEWDPNIGSNGACVLKDAKYVHQVTKAAEVTGMVALTLVTSVAGGPIVWVLAAVEATALVGEAVTADYLSDWAEGFIVDAARCNDSACADRVLKNHIARIIYGSRQFNDTQNKAIATQMQRLLKLLDKDILEKMVDAGISVGYISENRDPDLEKSLRQYYNTKLTNGERALLGINYTSTVLTFATLIGAGVTAGLRQAFKRNWIHLSEARQAKWLKYRILKPDDVAGLGGTGARGAGGARVTDDAARGTDDAARANTPPKQPKDGGPSAGGADDASSGAKTSNGSKGTSGDAADDASTGRGTAGKEKSADGTGQGGTNPGNTDNHAINSDLSDYRSASDKQSAKRKLLIKYHPDKVAGYNDAKLSQLAEDITQRVNNIDNLSESELRELSKMMDEFDTAVDSAESAKRAADAAKNTGNKSTGAKTSDDTTKNSNKTSNADDAARGAGTVNSTARKLQDMGFVDNGNGVFISKQQPYSYAMKQSLDNMSDIKWTYLNVDGTSEGPKIYIAMSKEAAAKQGLRWSDEAEDFVRAFNGQSSYGISKLNGMISSRKPLTEINGVPVYVRNFGEHSGRPIVMVEINGKKFPFYASTGSAGKNTVPTGKWEFFGGIGPDGWFNKLGTDDILAHYNSPELRKIANALDSQIGDVRNVEYVMMSRGRASLNGAGSVGAIDNVQGLSTDVINSGLNDLGYYPNVRGTGSPKRNIEGVTDWLSKQRASTSASSGSNAARGAGTSTGSSAANAGARATNATGNTSQTLNQIKRKVA